MKSRVSFMTSRCLCVKMAKTPHNHDSTYDHNKCPFFPFGSHLLQNALNQVLPFASTLRNLCGVMFKAQYKTNDTRHKNKKKNKEQQREQQRKRSETKRIKARTLFFLCSLGGRRCALVFVST